MVNRADSNPVIAALDFSEARAAIEVAEVLRPYVGGFKVGLELLTGPGPAVVAAVRDLGLPVFVDAKLHDIPTTVGRAARNLGTLGARWVTAHGVGGEAMLRAAAEGLAEGAGGHAAGVLVITVLTSLTAPDLASTGVAGTPGRQVARIAKLAASTGMEGVVCSVKELGDVAQVAPRLTKVTPGIRPGGSDTDDQARSATPEEAVARGADWMVVGRAITRAYDPAAAAAALLRSLKRS